MTVAFIIPCYNAEENLEKLVKSLLEQSDNDWYAHFIDDVSDNPLVETFNQVVPADHSKFSLITNAERKYALRNIIEAVQNYCELTDIVAVIDGDDQLCNKDTVKVLHEAYSDPSLKVAWTAHRWDINGMNISRALDSGKNPYQQPWSSSHLRTFEAGLLIGKKSEGDVSESIPESNFMNHRGEWFQRGYDQALMLPLLYRAWRLGNKWKYIPNVCYQYNINSVSVNDRDWAERAQLSTVNMVRSRGYLTE
jgi:glycosyltransferase involved in cell wall biosynthesis